MPSAEIVLLCPSVRLRGDVLRRVPVMSELLDVVDQAEELPLPIDLGAPAQSEPIEPLVVPHIAEHRLDRPEALGILRAPLPISRSR